MADRLAAVLGGHGHRPREEDLRLAWDAADAWFWDEYHRAGNNSWTSDEGIEDTWRSYHRLMLDQLGFADADREVLEAVLAAQMATEAWELYEDTLPALEALRPAGDAATGGGPAVAVVSDWGSELTSLLEGLGLTAYLDEVFASGAIGLAKPAEAFFRLACERAGVAPGEAVMIGDSLRADVLGARDAGLDAVLLDRAGSQSDVPADVPVATSLVAAVDFALGRTDLVARPTR
jgi:putative hydrolase of the HAD superfamily